MAHVRATPGRNLNDNQGSSYLVLANMSLGWGMLSPESRDDLPSLQDRIRNLGYTLATGLPASKHQHAVARLSAADHRRLARVLTGVAHALPLGPRLIPIRVLGANADAPGVASFVKAGGVIHDADSHADLREATDRVARSAQQMGSIASSLFSAKPTTT